MPIDFTQWAEEFRSNWTESPKRALLEGLYYTYLGGWLTATSRFDIGTNIYDRWWDLLVVLDACRVDALRAVAPEYDFLDASSIGTVWSVGSASAEWMCKTFTTDYASEIGETCYLSANPYATKTFVDGVYAPPNAAPFGSPGREVVDAADFGDLHNLYHERRDERFGIVMPEDVTDAAIYAGRNWNADRTIAHYMQPHTPYFTAALRENRELTDAEYKPWSALKRGEIDYDTAWTQYIDTLRYALDTVEVLLANVDAEKVIITADHGEAFGEWGAHNHLTGFPHPAVKKVPWVETNAVDSGWHEPTPLADSTDAGTDTDASAELVDEQLRALGYV
jgi:hypothetical protein